MAKSFAQTEYEKTQKKYLEGQNIARDQLNQGLKLDEENRQRENRYKTPEQLKADAFAHQANNNYMTDANPPVGSKQYYDNLKNPVATQTPPNLYSYYTSKGKSLPSIAERASLYEQHGLGSAADYAGRSDQNIALLGKLTGQQAQTSPEMASTSPITAKMGVGAGGGVNVAVRPNLGQGASTQTPQTPEIDPIEQKKQIMAQIDAKLRDFQLAQAKDDSTTYLKKVEDLAMPEQYDPSEERIKLYESMGVDSAQAEIDAVDMEIANVESELDKFGVEMDYRPGMSLNQASIAKSKEARLAQASLNTLYAKKAIAQQKLQNKQNTIRDIMDDKKTSYAMAKEEYNMRKENAEMLYDIFDKEQDEAKKDAKTNLDVLTKTITEQMNSGEMTIDDISDNVKNSIASLELQAGLPEGWTMFSIQNLKPDEEELATITSADQTTISRIVRKGTGEVETQTYSTGLKAKPVSGSGETSDVGGGVGSIERDAQSIMAGDLKPSQLSTAKNYAAQVMARVSELRKEATTSGDIYGMMGASAGGKEPSEAVVLSTEKAANVVGQIADLQSIFNSEKEQKNFASEIKKSTGIDINPQFGLLRKFNPYDQDAQTIKAALQGIVPNLARGIYGEVGVLTDNDIKNYSKTLPTLTSTEDVRKAVLGITIRSIQRSVENKIKSNVAAGRDMSGYKQMYDEIRQTADSLIGVETKQAGQTIKQIDGSEWKQNADGSFTQIK